MTTAQKEALKTIVKELHINILEEIKELEEKTQPIAPDCSLGRLTRLDAMQEKSINESILAKARIRLKKIEFTLGKIDHEDYGSCTICDEEIPYERLCVMPESTICVTCSNERDKS